MSWWMCVVVLSSLTAIWLPAHAFEVAPGSAGNRLYLLLWNRDPAVAFEDVQISFSGPGFASNPMTVFVPTDVPPESSRLAGFEFAVDANSPPDVSGAIVAQIDGTENTTPVALQVSVPLITKLTAAPLQGLVGESVTSLVPGLASFDTDGDTIPDQTELDFGTDPFDAASLPAVPALAAWGVRVATAAALLFAALLLLRARASAIAIALAGSLLASPAGAAEETGIQVVVDLAAAGSATGIDGDEDGTLELTTSPGQVGLDPDEDFVLEAVFNATGLSQPELGMVAWVPDPNDRELGLDELWNGPACDDGCVILAPNRTIDFTTEPLNPATSGSDVTQVGLLRIDGRSDIWIVGGPRTVFLWAPDMTTGSILTTFLRISGGAKNVHLVGGWWRAQAAATPDPNNPVGMTRITTVRASDVDGVFLDGTRVTCEFISKKNPGILNESDCRGFWADGDQIEKGGETEVFSRRIFARNSEFAGYRALEFFYADTAIAESNLYFSPNTIDPNNPYDGCFDEMVVKYVGVDNVIADSQFDAWNRAGGDTCNPSKTSAPLIALKRDLRGDADEAGEYVLIADNTFFNMCGSTGDCKRATIGIVMLGYSLGDIHGNTFSCRQEHICEAYIMLFTQSNSLFGPMNRFNRFSWNRALNFSLVSGSSIVNFTGDNGADQSNFDLTDPNNVNGNVGNEISFNAFYLKNADGSLQTAPTVPNGVDVGVGGWAFYLDPRNNLIYGNYAFGDFSGVGSSSSEVLAASGVAAADEPAPVLTSSQDPDLALAPGTGAGVVDELVSPDPVPAGGGAQTAGSGGAAVGIIALPLEQGSDEKLWFKAPTNLRVVSVDCACDRLGTGPAIDVRAVGRRRVSRALAAIECGRRSSTGDEGVRKTVPAGAWVAVRATGEGSVPAERCVVSLAYRSAGGG